MSIFNKSTSDLEARREAKDGIANRHYWLQQTGQQDKHTIEANYGEAPLATAIVAPIPETVDIAPTALNVVPPLTPEELMIGGQAVERSEQQDALLRARAAIDQIHDEGADSHEYGLAA